MAAIDELDRLSVLGKKVVDVYDLSEEGSLIMQCLKTSNPSSTGRCSIGPGGERWPTPCTPFFPCSSGWSGRRHLSGARIQRAGRDHFIHLLPRPNGCCPTTPVRFRYHRGQQYRFFKGGQYRQDGSQHPFTGDAVWGDRHRERAFCPGHPQPEQPERVATPP
jgi:hypothetical protein